MGLRVVGGKNLNNRMLAKVLTVRLGSPADLLTSVKPGKFLAIVHSPANQITSVKRAKF